MDGNDSHPIVPDEEKRLIRAVLFSEWGVPFDKFEKYYHELEGRPFLYKKLGFSSLKECLESIPDVVRYSNTSFLILKNKKVKTERLTLPVCNQILHRILKAQN